MKYEAIYQKLKEQYTKEEIVDVMRLRFQIENNTAIRKIEAQKVKML